MRDRHGTELTRRLRADLRRLAPDLLRWHLPRIAPDGRLRPGLTLSLARYGGHAGTSPQLVVRTPPAWADTGQRLSLALWDEAAASADAAAHHHPHPHPDRRFRLDLHRHLWDATRIGELALRTGGLTSPAPDGPACAAEGCDGAHDLTGDAGWAPERWAAEAEVLLAAEGRPRGAFAVRLGPRHRAAFDLVAPDGSHAPTARPLRPAPSSREVDDLPLLPEAAARALPDLELLRAGLVALDRLHPLVATALRDVAPQNGAGRGPAPDTPGALEAVAPAAADPHRVECRGAVHRIALRDGALTAVDHDPAELRGEELLVALGGPALPCLRAIDVAHREPEALPAVRERLGHGDVAGALDVLEGLLGPAAILREGPLREELEAAAAGRVAHGLFRSGLVAVHPAAAGAAARAANGDASGAGGTASGHRPRLDRRTPPVLNHKRRTRTRPRAGLFPPAVPRRRPV
ncbi:hypothetical protein SAMN05216267_1026104 [Actinacidiphila rubida]|uniref:Uncharacterized protein n=1 Tax=Actinacidiphila rubida TaxID=310780 RepID=A0A1H8PR80_9ACTN|nr:hypothetical protein SAMN05216267_1026104 [Actinacidiphila rubida]